MRFNQKGFSLTEILIAGALTSIVALGSAFVMYRTQSESTRATLQNDIDRLHYLNLQIGRNIANIQLLYNLPDANSDIAFCLKNQATEITDGKACNDPTVAQPWTIYSNQPNQSLPHGFPNLATPTGQDLSQYISSTISVIPNCDATSCSSMTIDVLTQYTGGPTNLTFQNRESKSVLPNYLFVDKARVSFGSCTGPNQILIGVDYNTNTPICQQISSSAPTGSSGPSGGLPIAIYDSGSANIFQVVTNPPCPNGYAFGGLFNGQSECNDPTKIISPPATTIPTPTTLNPASGCHWKATGMGYVTRPANTTTCNASNSTSPVLGNQCNCGSYANYCQNPAPTGTTDTYTYFYCDY